MGAWSLLAPSPAAAKLKILIMPKLVGIPYYNAVKQGVDQASNELKSDTTVIWQLPRRPRRLPGTHKREI
jgi:ABC-type sugar transport system substrate-binding protein